VPSIGPYIGDLARLGAGMGNCTRSAAVEALDALVSSLRDQMRHATASPIIDT
jgi:hypothetical protein